VQTLLLLLLTKPQLLWLLLTKPLRLLLLLPLLLGLGQSLLLWQLRAALLLPRRNGLAVESKHGIISTVSRPGRRLC
jgi:hypothetical protein